jgi:D-alanine-D-alanine ligase
VNKAARAGAKDDAMKRLDVLLVYNEPVLADDDPDRASEAGVLESVEAVSAALESRGHHVRTCPLAGAAADVLELLPRADQGDVAFNLFEGLGGVGRGEAEIAGALELAGWPLTGSPAACLALVRDKARTKWLMRGAGLPTPDFEWIAADGPIDGAALDRLLARGAVIVKPAHEDASLGIGPESIVSERSGLVRQIEQVRGRYGAVLVEQFIAGREFNAAIVAVPDPRLLPLSEIEFRGDGPPGWQIVTYDAKWTSGSPDERSTPVRCPAQVDPATAERLGQIALATFRTTGCRDYARVDLRMDADGQPYVLEVNANPDIGPAGIGYEDFIDRLVRNAFTHAPLGVAQWLRY